MAQAENGSSWCVWNQLKLNPYLEVALKDSCERKSSHRAEMWLGYPMIHIV